MSSVFENDTQPFTIVVNQEDQHAVWPAGWAVPAGWRALGASGARADCLARIEAAWPDIRPRSLRAQRRSDASQQSPRKA